MNPGLYCFSLLNYPAIVTAIVTAKKGGRDIYFPGISRYIINLALTGNGRAFPSLTSVDEAFPRVSDLSPKKEPARSTSRAPVAFIGFRGR